jgi:ABC-type transport system substrate-binding protein
MILREAFDYEFSRLDPTGAHIDPPSVAIYETLLAKGPKWGATPMLAESWEVAPDGLEWRMKLRPGLRFHSGAVCDATAVLRALESLRWEAPDRQLWYWDPVDRVSAPSPDALVFRLHHPYARLPALLWGTHTAIHNEALRASDPAAFGTEIVDGTGPFRLTSWSPERVVAARFEEYPGTPASFVSNRGPAPLDGIEWISITDERDRLGALEIGEVDCLHGPPLDEVERLRADPRFEVVEHGQPSNVYLALDWRRTELGFDDLRVRRAVSLALDRPAMVTRILAGHGRPTLGPLPPGDEFYDAEIDGVTTPDPAAAAGLLEAAAWQLGPDGVRTRAGQRLEFECVCQDDQVQGRIASAVAEQLAGIGVRLDLRPAKPFAPFYEACAKGPPASISKWLWQDPVDALIGFSATGGEPFPNWQFSSVPALDRAFEDWLRAGTPTDLRSAASRVQRIFADELPFIPVLTPSDVWVRSAAVRGYEPFAANLYPFYQDCRLIAGGGA